jgi:phenylacetate-CoA ligase
MYAPLADDLLFPLMTDASRRLLKRLREHPHAPRYNWRTGERLTADGLENVLAYARRQQMERAGWRFGQVPAWLPAFVQMCRRDVPFHRQRADWSDDFFSLPRIDRESLRLYPWAFVPDGLPIEDLIVYTTSGTTGDRLQVLSHPEVPSRYLPLLQHVLATRDITLEGGDRVSILQICAQKETNVMSSVSSYLGGAGFAKVNLRPEDWHDSLDPARFIDDCDPEIYTGDPFAFTQLMKLPLRTRPKAIISSATTLLPGLRQALESHFGCPVMDFYSLNESGPVAFAQGEGHEVLPHDLFVEILDAQGRACLPGERGEIVVTGGINPYLPLLRYRTGDYAAMDFSGPMPQLIGLQGRRPTIFYHAAGDAFNSVDVTAALKHLSLSFFSLHQFADRSVLLRTACDADIQASAVALLQGLFGPEIEIRAEQASEAAWTGKPIHYTSEISSTLTPRVANTRCPVS